MPMHFESDFGGALLGCWAWWEAESRSGGFIAADGVGRDRQKDAIAFARPEREA